MNNVYNLTLLLRYNINIYVRGSDGFAPIIVGVLRAAPLTLTSAEIGRRKQINIAMAFNGFAAPY